MAQQKAALTAAGCGMIREEQHPVPAVRGATNSGSSSILPARVTRSWSPGSIALPVRSVTCRISSACSRFVASHCAPPSNQSIPRPRPVNASSTRSAFETNLRKERQPEGIARAKAAGIYKGRKPEIDGAEIRRLAALGKSKIEIAEELDISRQSMWPALKQG